MVGSTYLERAGSSVGPSAGVSRASVTLDESDGEGTCPQARVRLVLPPGFSTLDPANPGTCSVAQYGGSRYTGAYHGFGCEVNKYVLIGSRGALLTLMAYCTT